VRYKLSESDIQRFWSKVVKTDSCWSWNGSHNPDGYPTFWLAYLNRCPQASRIMYSLMIGDVPEGNQEAIDHKCNNPGCVNPDHLQRITQQANVLRSKGVCAKNAAKALCHRGHPLTPFSKSTHADKPWRSCKVCAKERTAERRRLYRDQINARRRELRQLRKEEFEAKFQEH